MCVHVCVCVSMCCVCESVVHECVLCVRVSVVHVWICALCVRMCMCVYVITPWFTYSYPPNCKSIKWLEPTMLHISSHTLHVMQ